jgi:hypothetical protein
MAKLEVLVHEIRITGSELIFLASQQSGEIIKGVTPSRDRNGEPCMEIFPASGFEGMSLEEVANNWSAGEKPRAMVEVLPWGEDKIMSFLSQNFPIQDVRWFIPISDR